MAKICNNASAAGRKLAFTRWGGPNGDNVGPKKKKKKKQARAAPARAAPARAAPARAAPTGNARRSGRARKKRSFLMDE